MISITAIAGFILIVSFYFIYLGKQLLLRRQGIQTNRLGKGDKPAYTRRLEVLLTVLTFSIAFVQLWSSIVGANALMPIHTPLMSKVFGLAFSTIGVIFFFIAVRTMRNNWRAGVDASQKTEIVTTGIYKISRNPAFVGFDLFYIGTFLIFPSFVLALLSLVGIIVFHLQILEEEKFLPTLFGNDYDAYKKNVRRYL